MTQTELEERMKRVYRRHDRHRAYALDARSKRQLCAIFQACLETKGDGDVLPLFHSALEKLTDRGANFLRPKPREQRPAREPWKDAHGKAIDNPLDDPDKERRKRGMRTLKLHDPELADYYERSHADPFGEIQRRRAEAVEFAELNKIEAKYDEDAHSHNVFVKGSASDIAAFTKQYPSHAPIWQREARPVRSNAFGGEQHETTRVRIFNTDQDLWRIVEAADKHNRMLRDEEQQQAQRERAEAERKIAELQVKVDRSKPGQIITLAR